MRKITNFREVDSALASSMVLSSVETSYSLDRMKKLMNYLDNPQDKLKVIHVAGTSGKTSTCYYVAAMLHATGKKVGLTVSPYIDEINERVQIDMVPIDESEFCSELTDFLILVEKSDIVTSYFETLVAFAYWYFAKQRVDYAVVEVGLGGLLDGTNVVSRSDKVCVITDIGLDHINVLGHDLESIAKQKAGIILSNNNVFVHHQDENIMAIIVQLCIENKAKLHIVPDDGSPCQLPKFQQRNWSLARAVAEYLIGNLDKAVIEAAAQTAIPARMEVVKVKNKVVIIDGSHNQQKLQALSESLRQKFPGQPVASLVSFGQNKDAIVAESLKIISDLSTHIIFSKFQMARSQKTALEPAYLRNICLSQGFRDISTDPNPETAFRELLKRPEQILLVTGSFYLLNHIRPLILKK